MKNLHEKKGQNYEARIKLPNSDKTIYRSLGTRNKRLAKKKLDELYKTLELQQAGLLPSPAADLELIPLIRKYLSDLETTCSSQDYLNHIQNRLLAVSKACSWSDLSSVSPADFIDWRARQAHLMPKTLNDYLSAWTSFFSWLIDCEISEKNPLKRVKRIPIRGRVSFRRRALTDEEVFKLIALPDRRPLYLMALHTGLRRGELSKLLPSDFHLDAEKPFVRIRPETTKNGKGGSILLHSEVVSSLGFLSDLDSNKPFFPLLRPERFNRDCKEAGIVRERNGRLIGFHALRYTFCTRLARDGVTLQEAKELMRHSDIRMTTEIYTDAGLLGTDSAISLPSFSSFGASPQKSPQNLEENGKTNPLGVFVKLAEVLGIKAETLAETFSGLVEVRGVEPLTSCMPCKRSTN